MIVRNEERNLAQCLEPVRSIVDEIVIVDTGSTDRTRELARSLGAEVFAFPWTDDFSAARNESLRHATGDYILWLDADDRLTPDDADKLRHLCQSLDGSRRAVIMRTICQSPPHAEGPTVETHPRMFRAHPELRWQYRVHEQIMPSLERLEYQLAWSDTTIQHLGYADETLARQKANRNLRLCRLDYAVNPHDPCILYHLGKECAHTGHFGEALGYLLKSLRGASSRGEWVGKIYADAVAVLSHLRRTDDALALAAEGVDRCGSNAQLLIEYAELLASGCQYQAARKMLLQLLEIPRQEQFDSGIVADGFRRRAYRMLSAIAIYLEHFDEAEQITQRLLGENPADLQTWFMLAYLRIGSRRWDEVDKIIRQLRSLPGGESLACCAQAEVSKCQGDLAGALREAERAIALAPQQLLPRVTLADLLMCGGASSEACCAALREVLRLAPGHLPAQRALTSLEAGRAGQPGLCSSVTVGSDCSAVVTP
jgi:tetratricopeptide (TPR) repeat protein